jgi:DNA-binding MarR family transcriptional regulator
MSYSTSSFGDLAHERSRLGILAILAEASSSRYRFLRETLQLTDSNLSRYLGVLEAASLVKIYERNERKRSRTSVLITRTGRKVFAAEITALRALLGQIGDAPGLPTSAQDSADEPGHD